MQKTFWSWFQINIVRKFTTRKQILNMIKMHCMQFSKDKGHFKKQMYLLTKIASDFVMINHRKSAFGDLPGQLLHLKKSIHTQREKELL